MLRYFIEQKSLQEIQEICATLNRIKQHIMSGDFLDPYKEYNCCTELFEGVLQRSMDIGNEKLANAQFVFKQYFLLFCNLTKYFELLGRKEYRSSWDKLQDCIDDAQYVGKFANDRLDVPEILDLLRSYETLYPYNVFASSEYIITKSHCSICGKSMQSLECPHIKGNLYWGKPAVEVMDEIKEFQAVCFVQHPEDKRCIIESSTEGRNEIDKFQKLNQFLGLGIPVLQNFSVKRVIETRIKNIERVERNEPCSCGSGLKFKKCCGKNMYYKHVRNLVTLKKEIKLFYI